MHKKILLTMSTISILFAAPASYGTEPIALKQCLKKCDDDFKRCWQEMEQALSDYVNSKHGEPAPLGGWPMPASVKSKQDACRAAKAKCEDSCYKSNPK